MFFNCTKKKMLAFVKIHWWNYLLSTVNIFICQAFACQLCYSNYTIEKNSSIIFFSLSWIWLKMTFRYSIHCQLNCFSTNANERNRKKTRQTEIRKKKGKNCTPTRKLNVLNCETDKMPSRMNMLITRLTSYNLKSI